MPGRRTASAVPRPDWTVSAVGPTGVDVAARIGHASAVWRSIPHLLDERAAERPDAPAVAVPGEQATYAAVRAAAVRAARELRGAGVGPGDRVGVFLREASVAYVTTALGVLRLGAVVVPVNARNKARELRHVAAHSGMRLLLTEEALRPIVDEADLGAGCATHELGDPALTAGAAAVDDAELDTLLAGLGRDHVAQIVYTSGTTGLPKGCLHTHSTLLAMGENTADRLGMGPDDRFWTPLPLFHCGGWQTLLAAFSRGACFSHVGRFTGEVALAQLVAERCTHAFPAFELIWGDVLRQPGFSAEQLPALRMIMNVGPPEHLLQMQEQVPHAAQVSCMGSTECAGSVCIGAAEDDLDSRMRTSGAPLPGSEVRVLHPGTGEEVPVGGTGELVFRGVTTFVGYYRDEAATAAALDDEGWYRTGDLVTREGHGGVAFVSRMKDMLKVGGENVAAGEIEGYLIAHPAILQVAVVGAPDRRYGEVAAAFVQLQEGHELSEEEVVAFCRDRIASFKIPRYVRVVDAFPVTASQKVQKVKLREEIAAELRRLGVEEAPRLPRSGA